MKKKKLSHYKKKLWTIFSEYIRLKYTNPDGYVSCVTCGVVKSWKGDGMQAGHFLSGRSNGILFDERGVHPQCSIPCNQQPDGVVGKAYYDYMVKNYGQDVIDELRRLKRTPTKLSIDWYEGEINLYSAKVELLKNRLGIN